MLNRGIIYATDSAIYLQIHGGSCTPTLRLIPPIYKSDKMALYDTRLIYRSL